MIGQTISHYKILEKLGEGGMGVVYKAHDLKLDRDVALKFLPRNLTTDPIESERFHNEARAAAALTHQNIAVIYEIGEHDGQVFISMEYVDGQTLKSLLVERVENRGGTCSLSINIIMDIALQVAQGLSKAHGHGIVHRDIKPANLMINRDGIVKILDFGLAKLKGSAKLTKTGSTLGTAAYMSPEQARGEDTDHQTDIFSFGTLFYELLTGKLPFRGEHEAAYIYSIVNEDPIPDKSIPSYIKPVIDRCLQKNRHKRYQSADEIVRDIRNAHADPAGPVTPVSYFKYFFRVLVSLSIIAVFIVLYFLFIKRPAAIEKKSIAVLSFTDLSPGKDQEYFCDGMSEEIINALTKVPNLYVASRTSAFRFKGKESDIRNIGKELNVSAVLEGSIRKSGDNLRITAQLVNTSDGYHIWSETYDRTLSDVFSIQEDISQYIVNALKLTLGDDEKLIRQHTDNIDAYNLYLQGRYHWNMRNEADLRKSIAFFNQALEQDPRYALAYSGLADAYTVLADWGYMIPDEGYVRGYDAALKALRLDSTLAEAVTTTGYFKYIYEKNYPSAEYLFKKAISLNPNYGTAHQWYSEFLTSVRRFDEGLQEIKKAAALDPTSLMIKTQEAALLYASREHDKSIAQLKEITSLDSNFYPAYVYFMLNYYELRDTTQMRRSHRKLVILEGANNQELAGFDSAFERDGTEGIYQWQISWYKRRENDGYVPYDRIALFFSILGRRDSAFHYLAASWEKKAPLLYTLYAWPVWDKLRGDERYDALLHRLRFKW